MIRPEVERLLALGPMPDSLGAIPEQALVEEYQRRIEAISPPLSLDEALALTKVFGPDDLYGLAWTLLHVIESAPGWSEVGRSLSGDGEWITRLRNRILRAEQS